jgi:hypothetical protein
MTDGKKGFIWGVVVVLVLVFWVHACNTSDTPASSGNPTAPAQVEAPSGGTGGGTDGMYTPPSNLNPLPFIPSAPPAELAPAPEPAQAAPALAAPAPAIAAPSPQ